MKTTRFITWLRSLSWKSIWALILKAFTFGKPKPIESEIVVVPEPAAIEKLPGQEPTPIKKSPNDQADFETDEQDKTLFRNIANPDFLIRIIKVQPNGKERDKDQLVIATSFPHLYDSKSSESIRSSIHQLTEIKVVNSHELMITKSAACKFENFLGAVLRTVFQKLHKEYAWRTQMQKVVVERCPNPDILEFHLRLEVCRHLDLGRALFAINGVCSSLPGESFPLCMDHTGNYSFSLHKGKAFNWYELMPSIKEAFAHYFPAGVIFEELPDLN